MRSLIRAEIRKLTTTRTTVGLLLGAAALAAAITASTVASGARHTGAHSLGSPAGVRAVLGGAAAAEVFALVLGVLVSAGERRWGTEVHTYLLTPRRWRVTAAKAVVSAVAGAMLAVATATVTLAVAVPLCADHGATIHVLSAQTLGVLGGIVAAAAGYAVIGVGIGSLVPNQAAAVVAALVWALVAENAVLALLPPVGRWLPGGAAAALAQATLPYGGHLVNQWSGLAAMAAYAAGFAAVGARSVQRRDIG
jgi:ABC-type transport system involved in multi-copper enzyme maturation permease subunit